MDLINTYFPPFESHLHIYPFTLCINLSLRKAKSLHLDLLISSGIPKYVSIPLSFWIPSAYLISCLTVALILLPKSKEDLSKLIHWPDVLPDFLTTFITFSHLRSSALHKKKTIISKKNTFITSSHFKCLDGFLMEIKILVSVMNPLWPNVGNPVFSYSDKFDDK